MTSRRTQPDRINKSRTAKAPTFRAVLLKDAALLNLQCLCSEKRQFAVNRVVSTLPAAPLKVSREMLTQSRRLNDLEPIRAGRVATHAQYPSYFILFTLTNQLFEQL